MKEIQQAFQQGLYILDLKARNLRGIFHQVLNFLVTQEVLSLQQRDAVEQALLARENEASTAVGHATAMPHAYLPGLKEPVVAFVRLQRPLNLGAPDGIPTRFFFIMLGPTDSAAQHLETLMNVARMTADDEFRYQLGEAHSRDDLLKAFRSFQARTAPPAVAVFEREEVSEGLQFTGRFAGGLMADVRRRLPHYGADFRDGLHLKAVSATLFLFFACVAPAITFGGVMAVQTGGHIGPVEMLAATALCGVVYALFTGQPLIILGGTGPLLIFTVILYKLCSEMQIPFFATYAWVGLWTAAILIALAVTDSSALMRFFTRFTDEIFAALISLIFIYEAIKAIVKKFVAVYAVGEDGAAPVVSHDAAFLMLILALGTFFIALNLSRFRRSRYLLPQMREFLADFGPMIALGLMTIVAIWFKGNVQLEVLNAPDKFGPTFAGRSWLINPFDPNLPRWVWLAAAVPALLAAVLIYLDQNITARILNSPDNKLQRGEAYHLDLAVVGVLTGACSMLGLPWLVAATVRSLNHVRALATVDEVVSRNGDTREHIVHVRENRVTGLSIHLLVGASLLLLPYLKLIPMAVLYGIFLFMGVVSMKGNQFFERIALWPMDSSLYPAAHYIRRVKLWIIHVFTLIQGLCLGVLWMVKTGPPLVAIFFPLFIALLVPVRFLLGRFFTASDLAHLDAEETPEEEETHWGGG